MQDQIFQNLVFQNHLRTFLTFCIQMNGHKMMQDENY